MKRFLTFITLTTLLALGIAYGDSWTWGNTDPVVGTYGTIYSDTVAVKSGDATSKTITVPGYKQGYNLTLITLDPDTREESLEVKISLGNLQPVDNAAAYLPITQFGYDNSVDTFKLHGPFPSVTFDCTTRTAGADAADSIMWIHYQFYVK